MTWMTVATVAHPSLCARTVRDGRVENTRGDPRAREAPGFFPCQSRTISAQTKAGRGCVEDIPAM